MTSKELIIKNTLVMYIALFINIIIGIFYSRFILNNLGIEDFGIYSVIAGVVLMFGLVRGTMTTSVQRFLTYALGKSDELEVSKIFSASLIIHLIMAIIVFVIGETIGYWFFSTFLKIPIERALAASFVYHMTLISFLFNLISVPAQAMLNAYEKMFHYSMLQLINPIGRLVAAILIFYFPYDRLIFFAILTMCFSFLELLIGFMLSFIKCPGSYFNFVKDKKLYKELTSFASWGFLGELAAISKGQGIAVILNIFFGTVANASYGVAGQLKNKLADVSVMIAKASNPQIVKSYASAEKEKSFKVVTQSSKLCFALLYIVTIPFLLETEFLVNLWLNIIPPYSIIFIKLALINILIESLSRSLMTLSIATGEIKLYQSVVGGVLILNLPIAYLFLKLGFAPESVYWVSIFLGIIAIMARLIILKKIAGFSIKLFVLEVWYKVIPLILISVFFYFLGEMLFNAVVFSRLWNIILIPILLSWIVWKLVLTKNEQFFIISRFFKRYTI
jgi:O-antigen/teichoic acid export membrane protein